MNMYDSPLIKPSDGVMTAFTTEDELKTPNYKTFIGRKKTRRNLQGLKLNRILTLNNKSASHKHQN